MSFRIPIDVGDPFFDVQVTLEDVTYTLQFRWNVREEAWYMHILDAEGTTVLHAGLKLVADWPLATYTTERQPPGILVARDTSGEGRDPGLDDLGDRVQLVYYTLAEIEGE